MMQQKRRPSFWRQVLREAPVLVPAGIIFAVVQGGDATDWLIAVGAVALIGLAMGWLMYQRELVKQRPISTRSTAGSRKRRR